MSDADSERRGFDNQDRTSNEPMAGAANTPPFEPGDDDPRHSGRPPSHREGTPGSDLSDDRMEGIAPASGSTRRVPDSEGLRDRAAGALDEAEDTLSRSADRAAGGIEDAADRLRSEAERNRGRGGLRETAADWADRTADTGEQAADFLRDADVDDLRALVERQVRERPVQTILIAAATGWLVGKILR